MDRIGTSKTCQHEDKNNPLPLKVVEARVESCQIVIGNRSRYNLKHFPGIRSYDFNLYLRIKYGSYIRESYNHSFHHQTPLVSQYIA